jgi:hypothetical protein
MPVSTARTVNWRGGLENPSELAESVADMAGQGGSNDARIWTPSDVP